MDGLQLRVGALRLTTDKSSTLMLAAIHLYLDSINEEKGQGDGEADAL